MVLGYPGSFFCILGLLNHWSNLLVEYEGEITWNGIHEKSNTTREYNSIAFQYAFFHVVNGS